MGGKKIDRALLSITLLLLCAGFFIFTSASLGLLARDGASFSSVATSQILFGMVLGLLGMAVLARLNYRHLKGVALYIFIAAVALTVMVFIPGIGAEFNGAHRWLILGPISFQPAELLKIAYVLFLAAFFSSLRRGESSTFLRGTGPYLLITALASAPLVFQPDTGTLMVLLAGGAAILFASGARLRDIVLLFVGAILAIGLLAVVYPHVRERITTYLDPSTDPRGSSYQIQQSQIAIGSGGVSGRGFGQSVQKFRYLPEPVGDSIFAVYAEEFGFLGALSLITLYLLFGVRAFRIATRAPDQFGALLVIGLATLIVAQSFVNIAAMLGVIPLTGVPLPLVSHGGSAMMVTLSAVGIILSVSRYRRNW